MKNKEGKIMADGFISADIEKMDMKVISHGKENLDVELSGNAYRICGGFGMGENYSVFL